MKILGRNISPKTQQHVEDIYASLPLSVRYFTTAERPNKSYQVAGAVDVHGNGEHYSVWLDKSLPQDAFEADLLHELRHIVQVLSGFSTVYNKDSHELYSSDKEFIREVGAHLASTVLDMEVNTWLRKNGYSPDFFIAQNLNGALKHASHQYQNLDDPLNFANVVLSLLLVALPLDDTSAAHLSNAYSAYPAVTACVDSLRSALLSVSLDNPTSSTWAHGLLIDRLGLWKYYYVATPSRKIRTHKEYANFAEEIESSLRKEV